MLGGEENLLCHPDSGLVFDGYVHTHALTTQAHVSRMHTVSDSLVFSRWESMIVNLEEHAF